MASESLFQSFLMGGFECSSQRTRSGERMDLLAATGHDLHAAADYARLAAHGITTVRDGIRWHMIERTPNQYDFSSVLPMVRAAHATGVQVIWDLCHYGWPDDLDVFSPLFVRRLADLGRAFARLLAEESDATPFIVPMNEISFLSWAAGEVGMFFPGTEQQGYELKVQLARAAIEATAAIRDAVPHARIVHPDPVIHVAADSDRPEQRSHAEGYRQAQFQAWDMICGRREPQLGGQPGYLDIIGINYYPHNQWFLDGPPIPVDHPHYLPFRRIIREVAGYYGRPIFISETSSLGPARPEWLRYIGCEVRAAIRAGAPVAGICLYPIVDFPDWHDIQQIHHGLWEQADEGGQRILRRELARELTRQQRLCARIDTSMLPEEPSIRIPARAA